MKEPRTKKKLTGRKTRRLSRAEAALICALALGLAPCAARAGEYTSTVTENDTDGAVSVTVTGSDTGVLASNSDITIGSSSAPGTVSVAVGSAESPISLSSSVYGTVSQSSGSLAIYGSDVTIGAYTSDSSCVAYGQRITSSSTNTVTADSLSITASSSAYNAYAIYSYSGTNTITTTGDVSLNASGSARATGIYNADTNTITAGGALSIAATASTSYAWGISNSGTNTITADSVDIAVSAPDQAQGINNSGINTITATGSVNITAESTSDSATYSAWGISNSGTNTITADSVAISATSAGKNAYTVSGSSSSSLNIDADTIEITADAPGDAYAAISESGSSITLGNDNSNITVTSTTESGSAIGIFALTSGSTVTVNGESLTVNSTATGEDGCAWGIHVQNNTQTEEAPDGAAHVIINAETTTVVSTDIALSTFSNGQLDINGNLYATADHVIDMRGYSTMNINTSGENTVVLTGDIVFETPGASASSGTAIDAYLNLSLTDSDSSWTGNTYMASSSDGEYTASGAMNITLSNGATWNVTDVSDKFSDESGNTVQELAITTLTSDGGVISLTEGGTAVITDIELTGDGLTVNVEDDGGELDYGTMTGDGGLTKEGDGTLTLATTTEYTGETTVNGGTLVGEIPEGTDLTIASGATYDGSDASGTAQERAIGALNGEGSVVNTAGLTVESGEFAGTIDDTNTSLTKTGDGTLTLSGENTYTGDTTLEGGTLVLANSEAASDSTITTSDGTTLTLSFDDEFDNTVTGTGDLTVDTDGTVTLTGTNDYTGATTVESGTLRVESDTALSATSGVTVESDATLTLAYNGEFDKDVTGEGGLTADAGSGNTVTVTGSLSYTGETTVTSGTLDAGSTTLASDTLTIYSGATFATSAGQSFSTLNVNAAEGGTATYDGNLSVTDGTLNFISSVSPDAALLTVTGDADVSNSSYHLGVSGGTQLAEGTVLTLIEAQGTLTSTGLSAGDTIGTLTIGSTLAQEITADVSLGKDGNSITGVAQAAKATEGSKALSEGWISGTALVLQGSDLIADKAIEAASAAANGGPSGAAFAVLGGGSLSHDTGSSTDIDSFTMAAGLSWERPVSAGILTSGLFVEYGHGSYDTYNSFNNSAVRGGGDSDYVGGGVLARVDFDKKEQAKGHLYTEASGRVGRVKTDFKSHDLTDASGVPAEYDGDSNYFSLHAGIGYVWDLRGGSTFDLYGKYFWTRTGSDSMTLSTGEDIRFDHVDSSRIRLGGRYTWKAGARGRMYAGLAWEYEFDGDARGYTNGAAISEPSLGGGTGIGEIGYTFRPAKADSPWVFDIGVTGYTGTREGVTGRLQASFSF